MEAPPGTSMRAAAVDEIDLAVVTGSVE